MFYRNVVQKFKTHFTFDNFFESHNRLGDNVENMV